MRKHSDQPDFPATHVARIERRPKLTFVEQEKALIKAAGIPGLPQACTVQGGLQKFRDFLEAQVRTSIGTVFATDRHPISGEHFTDPWDFNRKTVRLEMEERKFKLYIVPGEFQECGSGWKHVAQEVLDEKQPTHFRFDCCDPSGIDPEERSCICLTATSVGGLLAGINHLLQTGIAQQEMGVSFAEVKVKAPVVCPTR